MIRFIKIFSSLLFLVRISCAQVQEPKIEIQLKNNDAYEAQTKEQLLRILSGYDLKKWIFTEKIIIEGGFKAFPHSHPILTLHTRHLKDDELLLSTFIHEQLHWFVGGHPRNEEVFAELKQLFPGARIIFPEGSGDETSTYYHILICHLEYKALKQLFGELKAHQIITFWQQDHYRWVYKTVLDNQTQLRDLVTKYGIAP